MHETHSEIIAATAAARIPATQPTDHVELLMLDEAVARVSERFFLSGALSDAQRDVLAEYGEDVDHLLPSLRGPARDFAEQLGTLVEAVLRGALTVTGSDRARCSPAFYAA